MSKIRSAFTLDINLDADGRQDGYLRVKSSSEHLPFGSALTPMTSIRNGDGPCIIVMGGCHGDEYEGQIIARSLLNSLDPAAITGQIIILPAANPLAVRWGRRFASGSNGNLNTAFPGKPDGSSTERIAHFIETTLLPRANLVIDIHSGGKPVEYFPTLMMSGAVTDERRAVLTELATCVGLPIAFFLDDEDEDPSSVIGACARADVLNISAEIGGGGALKPNEIEMGLMGVLRAISYMGGLKVPVESPMGDVRILRRLPVSETVFSPASGLFEPMVSLGDLVEVGQVAGYLHDLETPWKKPIAIHFATPGLVLCRRLSVATDMGDGLFKLAVPIKTHPASAARKGSAGSLLSD